MSSVVEEVDVLAAVAPTGEVALTGASNSLKLGEWRLAGSRAGDSDAFFARLAPNGDARWGAISGSEGSQVGRGIAFDRAGNTVATGTFGGTLSLGSESFTALSQDLYVAKFDPSGKATWARHFGADDGGPTGTGQSDPVAGVAVDHEDNVVLAGWYSGTLGFGGAPLETTDRTTFIAKLSPTGRFVWSEALGGAGHLASAVAIDTDDTILLGGANFGSLEVGGHDFTVKQGQQNAYVARLSANGKPLWYTQLGGSGTSQILSVTTDALGNVIVAGSFSGFIEVGQQRHFGFGDGFVAKLTAGGALTWFKSFDQGQGIVRALATDAQSNIYVTGWYSGELSFAGQHLRERESAGAYLVELSPEGTGILAKDYSATSGVSMGTSIAVVDDDLLLAGWFGGSIDLGLGAKTVPAGFDLFVGRIPR